MPRVASDMMSLGSAGRFASSGVSSTGFILVLLLPELVLVGVWDGGSISIFGTTGLEYDRWKCFLSQAIGVFVRAVPAGGDDSVGVSLAVEGPECV